MLASAKRKPIELHLEAELANSCLLPHARLPASRSLTRRELNLSLFRSLRLELLARRSRSVRLETGRGLESGWRGISVAPAASSWALPSLDRAAGLSAGPNSKAFFRGRSIRYLLAAVVWPRLSFVRSLARKRCPGCFYVMSSPSPESPSCIGFVSSRAEKGLGWMRKY